MAIASDVKEETEYRNIQENIQIKAKSVCATSCGKCYSMVANNATAPCQWAGSATVPECNSATVATLLCYSQWF